jgi:exodeoxyribonuclease-5
VIDNITLSSEQQRALSMVKDWYHDPGSDQVFRLFGHAGVGKTTIAKIIVSELGLRQDEVLYGAYTGKAAYRLAEKGCYGAMTIHKMIYVPVFKARDHIEKLIQEHAEESDPVRKAELARQIDEEERNISQPGFTLNPDSPLQNARLCIIDEVSMVNDRMAYDLLSFGVKILVLGDPAQLPPVRGTGYFMTEPDILLTEPQRFGGLSSVLKVATMVRHEEKVVGMVAGDDDGPVSGRWNRPITIEQALRFDVILVWRNDTRWRINRMIRRARGFDGDYPNDGERIIILSNNYDLGVYNGQELVVRGEVENNNGVLTLRAEDSIGGVLGDRYPRLPLLPGGFVNKKSQEAAERTARGMRIGKGVGVATFAHAITTHKSQGSEWDKVLVIDESAGIKYMSGDEQARQWLYTAVTRAGKQVVIAPEIAGAG